MGGGGGGGGGVDENKHFQIVPILFRFLGGNTYSRHMSKLNMQNDQYIRTKFKTSLDFFISNALHGISYIFYNKIILRF